MKEDLISYKTAVLAKEKGFNEGCISFYGLNNVSKLFELYDCKNRCPEHLNSSNPISISAPTQSLLQKWLREEHDIYAYIDWLNMEEVIYDMVNDKLLHYKSISLFNGESMNDMLDNLLQEALKLNRYD